MLLRGYKRWRLQRRWGGALGFVRSGFDAAWAGLAPNPVPLSTGPSPQPLLGESYGSVISPKWGETQTHTWQFLFLTVVVHTF